MISIMAITPVSPWCTTAGGVGDYSTKCTSSVGKWTVSVLEHFIGIRFRGLFRDVSVLCHYLYNTTPSKSSLKTPLKSHVLNVILSVTLNVVLNVLLIAKINGTRSLSFELELTWTRLGT